jgi:hypothetical protein
MSFALAVVRPGERMRYGSKDRVIFTKYRQGWRDIVCPRAPVRVTDEDAGARCLRVARLAFTEKLWTMMRWSKPFGRRWQSNASSRNRTESFRNHFDEQIVLHVRTDPKAALVPAEGALDRLRELSAHLSCSPGVTTPPASYCGGVARHVRE